MTANNIFETLLSVSREGAEDQYELDSITKIVNG